jgi:hypothetical protein
MYTRGVFPWIRFLMVDEESCFVADGTVQSAWQLQAACHTRTASYAASVQLLSMVSSSCILSSNCWLPME